MREYCLFTLLTKNYLDAYEFVINSWIKTDQQIILYTDFDLESPHKNITVQKVLKPNDDWLENVGRKINVSITHFENIRHVPSIFIDIDCLIKKDISEIFDNPFDIAVTRLEQSILESSRGTASSGFWAARNSSTTRQFMRDWLSLSKRYRKRGWGIRQRKISYAQYSFTSLIRQSFLFKTYGKIINLDGNIYNCEDSDNEKWLQKIQLYRPSILHFKGQKYLDKELIAEVNKVFNEN